MPRKSKQKRTFKKVRKTKRKYKTKPKRTFKKVRKTKRKYKTKQKRTFKKVHKTKKGGRINTKRTRRSNSTNSRKVKYKVEKCAPKSKDEILGYTCYSSKNLHKMKQIWNTKHPELKITSNNPKTIWQNLRYAFKETCEKESCWLKQKLFDENIAIEDKDNIFAPKAPEEWKKKPDEWLSSIEIMQVMKQYEKTYKCFEFIGPSPIDYDTHLSYGECVWEELCKFNLQNNIQRGKFKVGIIFNLDKHTKDGSHWVALFINIKKHKIYYLDSYGEKISRQINKFANKVKKQARSLNLPKFELLENKKRHQFSNSECGMYSLYFIIEMLKK